MSSALPTLAQDLHGLYALQQRVSQLTDQTRWQTSVPLGPRAFVNGEIVHTNDVKVHLGAGWWVDVTARQASEIVGRKIEALEAKIQQVRLQVLEGLPSGGAAVPVTAAAAPAAAPPTPSSTSPAPPASTPAAPVAPSTAAVKEKANASSSTPVPSSDSVQPKTATPAPTKAANAAPPKPSKPSAAAAVPPPSTVEKAELVPLLLPSGQPQLAPEDNLPLYELRLAVDGLLDAGGRPGGKGRLEPLPRATAAEREARRRERERIWAEVEEEERVLEGRPKGADGKTSAEDAVAPAARVEAAAAAHALAPTTSTSDTHSNATAASPAPAASPPSSDLAKLQKALDALDLPAPPPAGTADGDVVSNALAELVDEAGRPISRIAIPVPASASEGADDEVEQTKKAGPAPLPKRAALTPAQEAARKAERDRLLDLLEAEEADAAAGRSSSGVRDVRRLPELSSPAHSDADDDEVPAPADPKGKGKGKARAPAGPERRKSVQWSETDQVQEFDFREAIALASDPSLLPASLSAAEDDGPPAREDKKSQGPVVKDLVVERPIQPVVAPAANKKNAAAASSTTKPGPKPPIVKEIAERLTPASTTPSAAPTPRGPLVKEIAERPTPTVQPAPPALEEEPVADDDDEVDPTADLDDYDDDDDDGSYELSDLSDHSSDADGDADGPASAADLGMDMDDKLLMREAAVSYYRLKGALHSRGGLEGLLRGMGEAGGGDEPEFVPLNATLASDLDEVRLAPAEHQLADSKFHTANTALSSIALPTLVPGGSATGVLKNAIRVGRLENGELVLGGDDSGDEDEGEDGADELEQAGKEALMWGMVGGVVVRPEDLAEESDAGKAALGASLPPPPPALPQEAPEPPRTAKLAAKAGSSKKAPVVASTPTPAVAVAPAVLPKPTLKTPTVPAPLESSPSSLPAAPPTQLVGTPFERSTPVSVKAPSAAGVLKPLDDAPADGPRRMSKFRMRQQGLTDDV